jgi:signal transduction histidine kinase
VAETLDSALKARVRAVLDRGPVTETQLRSLSEEGQACRLIVTAQLERAERRLGELSADPRSPLTELTDAYRTLTELRPDLDELESLLEELEARARTFRASWLTTDGRPPR